MRYPKADDELAASHERAGDDSLRVSGPAAATQNTRDAEDPVGAGEVRPPRQPDYKAHAEALAGALEAVDLQWKRPGEGHSEYFERQAERFYRETGLLAPGKSEPVECASIDRDREREAKWKEFFERPRTLMDGALAAYRESAK